ncbi:MAG TPA: HAMP domain-containing sensor histidine kinase [Leptolyngbyaceae cyanobacterium]
MDKISKRQRIEMERFNQLKDDFLSTISHELRSPVTNIKVGIQMLKLLLQQEENRAIVDSVSSSLFQPIEQSDDHTIQQVCDIQYINTIQKQAVFRTRASQYLEVIENECDREIKLLNNLLDLQQLDAGNYVLNQTVIRLQDWIPQIVEPFLNQMANQQQILHIKIAGDLPILTIDSPSLERIITELLTNGCKFTPPGGEITVAVGCVDSISSNDFAKKIELKVANSRVEIPPDELSQIFERFYRIADRDRWKHDGTGLGLVLVKKLTEYLGGSIFVKSGCEQTCFIVELPVNL